MICEGINALGSCVYLRMWLLWPESDTFESGFSPVCCVDFEGRVLHGCGSGAAFSGSIMVCVRFRCIFHVGRFFSFVFLSLFEIRDDGSGRRHTQEQQMA